MSDYEYRPEGDYDDTEKVQESEVQVEHTPAQTSREENNRYHYQDNYYGRNSSNQGYYGDTGYENRGRYRGYDYIPEEPSRRNKKEKKSGSWFKSAIKVAGFAVVFGAVAGGTFAGVNIAREHIAPSTSTSQKIETTTADSSKDSSGSTVSAGTTVTGATDVSGVVDQVMPSVVSVTGTYQTNNVFGFGTQESTGAGSGFLIAEDDSRLMIATNAHVVADSTSLTAGFIDDTTAKATIVGKDTNADLAVISVDKKDLSQDTLNKIKIATLGDSDSLKVGESVIIIGNAMGYGQSATMGILSAKDREVSFTDGTMTLLQTDAAINPGNSGGVMINLKGEVVGISNAKLVNTEVESMCYAIPITTANTVLTDLMNAEDITEDNASYLGIVGKNIDASYSQALNMPQGIYVSKVVAGSPAETAGLSAGDIITAMDGNNLSTMSGLIEKLSIKKAGTEVTLTYKRAKQNGEYEEKEVKVTLGKASDFQDETSTDNSQSGNNRNGNNGNGFGNGNGNGNGNGSDDYDYYNGNGGEMDPFYYFFNR